MVFKRSLTAVFVTVFLSFVALIAVPTAIGATSTPPAPQNFGTSSMTVFAGAQVTLHWNSAPNLYFLLTSNAPDSLPNFNSGLTAVWPSGSNAIWDSTWGWWQTSNSQNVKLTIPSNAASGTKYALQLYTCDSTANLCSNAPGGGGNSQLTMTVASNWLNVPYTNDFLNTRFRNRESLTAQCLITLLAIHSRTVST